ncbi:MAG: potassium transporter TrkG [Hyphomonadaceae bacterium]
MSKISKRLRLWLGRLSTPRLLFLGYFTYMALGWCVLASPLVHEQAVSMLDALFIAVSAVSTTGLVTVDPGSSFNLAGEIVILVLIQLGGIGYMTAGSILALALRRRLSLAQHHALVGGFGLPDGFSIKRFLAELTVFTLAAEALGAAALWWSFAHAGIDNAPWLAIFHSVSAFCTAGFSLFPNSLENFRGDTGVNLTVAALSYLGAIGFLVFADIWDTTTGKRNAIGFSTRVVLIATPLLSIVGAIAIFFVEPSVRLFPFGERAMAAFFQSMTAVTTVGFNTVPIGPLAAVTVLAMYVLMMFGASPAGTGGGLKSTTLATLVGLLGSTLRGRSDVRLFGRMIAPERIQLASAAVTFYVLALFASVFTLLLTQESRLDVVVFEAVSALGTVGLSMGATSDLTATGKVVIILLMFMGRVGVLTFGLALVAGRPSGGRRADLDEIAY